MKVPKRAKWLLQFKHQSDWYLITSMDGTYQLYHKVGENDFDLMATGKDPYKLEQSVYSGSRR